MSSAGLPSRDQRPLRKVVGSRIATLSGAEASGDHYDDELECGHFEARNSAWRHWVKRRRCSSCSPNLPEEKP